MARFPGNGTWVLGRPSPGRGRLTVASSPAHRRPDRPKYLTGVQIVAQAEGLSTSSSSSRLGRDVAFLRSPLGVRSAGGGSLCRLFGVGWESRVWCGCAVWHRRRV